MVLYRLFLSILIFVNLSLANDAGVKDCRSPLFVYLTKVQSESLSERLSDLQISDLIASYLRANRFQEAIWELNSQKNPNGKVLENITIENLKTAKVTRVIADPDVYLYTSKPYVVELENGIRGIFKYDGPTENYKFEIAAYHIDQYLGLNIVPITIERSIEVSGKMVKGSLQLWIYNAVQRWDLTHDQISQLVKHPNYQNVFLLDYLIGNVDRLSNKGNLIIYGDYRPAAIDNGFTRNFLAQLDPGLFLLRFQKNPEVLDRLTTLSSKERLYEIFGGTLSPEQIVYLHGAVNRALKFYHSN